MRVVCKYHYASPEPDSEGKVYVAEEGRGHYVPVSDLSVAG